MTSVARIPGLLQVSWPPFSGSVNRGHGSELSVGPRPCSWACCLSCCPSGSCHSSAPANCLAAAPPVGDHMITWLLLEWQLAVTSDELWGGIMLLRVWMTFLSLLDLLTSLAWPD